MDFKVYLCLIIIGLQTGYCQSTAVDSIADHMRIIWYVTTNSPTSDPMLPYEGEMVLEYKGEGIVQDLDWEIYFCSIRILFPDIITEEDGDVGVVFPDSNIIVYHVNGCLHKLKPLSNFTGFYRNIPVFLPYKASDWSVARTDVMPRWYVASSTGAVKTIASTAGEALEFVLPYDTPEKWKRIVEEDQYNPFSPEQRFNLNMAADTGSPPKRVIPTPKQEFYNESVHVDISTGDWVVVYRQSQLQGDAEYLAEKLGVSAVDIDDAPVDHYIEINSYSLADQDGQTDTQDTYEVRVMPEEQKINISGATVEGVFYGIQTLLSLNSFSSRIPSTLILDWPRYTYRGMHLDVSRNFIEKVEVLKLLEVMAMYKMNKLHFHLTDDEGWRLHIDTLTELTETGSKRCFSLNEDECLITQLGSGPSTSTSGSGFYTEEDYKEMLRFAQTRHIEVIPEFDMPGHGYAAVKSMEARYNKYKDTDMAEARKYLLTDFNDTSTYLSAQIFRDNAINPCMESTYTFVKEVVRRVKFMHQDIQPLDTFHFGGDEVAEGAWLKSPECHKFVSSNPDLVANVSKLELHRYFSMRVAEIVNDEGLNLGGWEDGLGHETTPINRTDLPNEKVIVHAWNNIWEQGNGERAYTYANAGYQVVISHASHFYFDHPQEPDPEERGYYWATRYSDTYKTFGYMPDEVYANIDTTRMGVPIDREEYCAPEDKCIPLDADKTANIIGIQGQLFSETCRTPSQLQSQVYPRIVAVAERAWHKAMWESSKDMDWKAADWERFVNTLAHKELNRLERLDIHYYIPPPGARLTVLDGAYYLEVNVNFPGLPILYTTDGGDTWSPIQANVPTVVDPDLVIQVQVRSADGNRSSRSVTLQTDGPLSTSTSVHQTGVSILVLGWCCYILLHFIN